ncbi:MAG TPA: biotin--[acetyl-CoA-carboxylase] ligase [Candidatus Nanopelagicaceae bacterium]|nr:biotin--[acetyl-CoA-carboxylase] ligase [Candidatus Nanopelagicaceae bacterium]
MIDPSNSQPAVVAEWGRGSGGGLRSGLLRQELAAAGVPYRVRAQARVSSTQDMVLAAARAGEPEGLVVIADHQTRGRGRAGHSWIDAPGTSLMFSLLWRPLGSAAAWGSLSLAAGLAVAEGIEAAGGPVVEVKWPNDCLTGGRKLAGILVETGISGGSGAAVVGVGCNVAWAAADPALGPEATAADLAGFPVDLTELAAAVLGRLHVRYREWSASGFGALLPAWTARCSWLGRRVVVSLPDGFREGEMLGVDGDGSLRLGIGGSEVLVSAGDLSQASGPALRVLK